EKDFKERVAIMDGLYRSVYEIQELNLKNRIRTFFWNNDYVSFELVYDKKLIHFYIATHKRYSELLQKQILTYYPDADVAEVEPYEIAPKGKKTKGFFLYLSRLTYFPIRTYKQMGSDPLNEMTNVFSKLGDNDTAAIQIQVNPRGRKWSKEAKEVAERLFKKQSVGLYFTLKKIPLLGPVAALFGGLFGMIVKGEAPTNAPGASSGDSYIRMLASEEEILKNVGEKANQEGFDTTIRIMASSDTEQSAGRILDAIVLGVNNSSNHSSNWFQNRRILPRARSHTPALLLNLRHRLRAYGERSSILVPPSLTSPYHIPTSTYNSPPIIKWLDYTVLPPPTN